MAIPSVDVSLVIPVRNEAATVGRLLESIRAQRVLPREVIVVDGGSTDATPQAVESFHGLMNLRLIRAREAFPGRGRNLGVAATMTEWIAFTDAGICLDPGWLEALLRPVQDHPDVRVVYGHYEPMVDSMWTRCVALAFVPPARQVEGRPFRNHFIASSLIHRQVWEHVGGFPEQLRSAEDLIFMARVERLGVRIAYAPQAVVHWEIPRTLRALFVRFRRYSVSNLEASLFHQWHGPLLRLYLVGALGLVTAVVVHWSFGLMMGLLVGARVAKALWIRGQRPTIRRLIPWVAMWVLTGLMIFWIDLAVLVGMLDWWRERSYRVTVAFPVEN